MLTLVIYDVATSVHINEKNMPLRDDIKQDSH